MTDADNTLRKSAIVIGVGTEEGLGRRLAQRCAKLGLDIRSGRSHVT